MARWHVKLGVAGAMAAFLLVGGVGTAATGQLSADWVGGASGSFDDPANWSTGSVPDWWLGGGVGSARIPLQDGVVPRVAMDTTYHTLGSLNGSARDVLDSTGMKVGNAYARIDADHDLYLQNQLAFVDVSLGEGADLFIPFPNSNAYQNTERSVVRSATYRPWLIPQMVLRADAAPAVERGVFAVWGLQVRSDASQTQTDALGNVWPQTPIRIEAVGETAGGASLSVRGTIASWFEGVDVAVPVRVEDFGGLIVSGMSPGQWDTSVTVAAGSNLQIEGIDTGMFGPNASVTLETAEGRNDARLSLGFGGGGVAVPYDRLGLSPDSVVGVTGRYTREQLFELSDRVATVGRARFSRAVEGDYLGTFLGGGNRSPRVRSSVLDLGASYTGPSDLFPSNAFGLGTTLADVTLQPAGGGPTDLAGNVGLFRDMTAVGGLVLEPAEDSGRTFPRVEGRVVFDGGTVKGFRSPNLYVGEYDYNVIFEGWPNDRPAVLELRGVTLDGADVEVIGLTGRAEGVADDAFHGVVVRDGLTLANFGGIDVEPNRLAAGSTQVATLRFEGTQRISGEGVIGGERNVNDGDDVPLAPAIEVVGGDLTIGDGVFITGGIDATGQALIYEGLLQLASFATTEQVPIVAREVQALAGFEKRTPFASDLAIDRLLLGPDATSLILPSDLGLSLSGTAVLDGALALPGLGFEYEFPSPSSGPSGYTPLLPEAGAAFTLIEAASFEGSFDTLDATSEVPSNTSLPQLGPTMEEAGLGWEVSVVSTEDGLAALVATAVLLGDFDGSGSVEQGDLDMVLGNWGEADVAGWTGRLSSNALVGAVDQAELDAVLGNWGSSAAPDFRGMSVPEPGVAVGLGLMGVGLGRRRSRRG